MKIYSKQSVQNVNSSFDECWSFFLSPRNHKITPSDMGFEITDYDGKPSIQSSNPVKRPLLGITLSWMTVITRGENSYFIDEQRFGPYAYGITNTFLKQLLQA
jgi:hypothetical protein